MSQHQSKSELGDVELAPTKSLSPRGARRVATGLAVRAGVRAGGSKTKTSDKQQAAVMAFVKG